MNPYTRPSRLPHDGIHGFQRTHDVDAGRCPSTNGDIQAWKRVIERGWVW